MEIIDILTKYGRNNASESTSLPPIDQNGSNLLQLMPSAPRERHKGCKSTPKKAHIASQMNSFAKHNKTTRTDCKPTLWTEVPRGDIDSWPLGNTTRGKPREEESENNIRRLKDERSTPAKPLLLQQLEVFVAQELQILGHGTGLPDDSCNVVPQARVARLQVFRECFIRLVEEFKTYKTLLLSIKNEYEAMLDMYSNQVTRIPQYEATIRTLEQEAQQTISEQQLLNKMKIKEWKKQLKATQASLAAYATANAALTDEKSKLTMELQETMSRLNDVMATNQALLHSMKRQDERQKDHDSQMSDLHGSLQSITTKYSRAQEEISELRNSIVMLEDKASGIDINADRTTIEHLTKELQELIAFREKTNSKTYLEESGVIATCLSELRSQGIQDILPEDTPEVELTVANFVNGIVTRCRQPTPETTKMSDSVFITQDEPDETVLSENEENCGEYIVCLGMEENVPEYLRFDGRVRNKFFSKRETDRLIRDIWLQKATAEKLTLRETTKSGGGHRNTMHRKSITSSRNNATPLLPPPCIPLRQYILTYLNSKYPQRTDIAECAYNLRSALSTYQYDSECRSFLLILDGELPEDARADLLQVTYGVYEAFVNFDKNDPDMSSNKRKGYISVGSAIRELHILFPLKCDEAMLVLCRAILVESKGNTHINYTSLFEQDKNGNYSSFCECIRSQYLEELTTFKRMLLKELTFEEKRAGPESNGMIPLDSLRRVIQKCDPSRTVASTNALLVECTTLPLDRVETESTTLVNANAARAKISALLIKPFGKLPLFD